MSTAVKLVRIYFKEGDRTQDRRNLIRALFNLLHNEHRVRGVTVFRGMAGFGSHGVVQTDDLLHLNVHLPLVLELFDAPEVVDSVMPRLCELIPAEHIISWEAQAYDGGIGPK